MEEKRSKDNADTFFQRFVMRTRLMRKSPSNLSSQRVPQQQRPGLLMTLFGNPIQKLRKQGNQQACSLDRQTSYAVVRTNHVEEGNDFEVCHEFIAQHSSHPPTAVGNGTRSNNFYRPPRIYQQQQQQRSFVLTSTHQDGGIMDNSTSKHHALKSEVRVLSAPAVRHKPLTRMPPPPTTPPKPSHKSPSAVGPTSNKMPIQNGEVTRKISAPAGTSSKNQSDVSKKYSVAANASLSKKNYG